MRYFPAFFDIADQPVTIIGGGALALRKARLMLKAGPKLTLVAPSFEASLTAELQDLVKYREGKFTPYDLDGARLVIAATGEPALDEAIARAAKTRNIPVNVVDRPDLCDFVVPSLVERGDLTIGISTGGGAPALGKMIRGQIEALLPKRLGGLVAFAKSKRPAVAATIAEEKRKGFWEQFFTGPIATRILNNDPAEDTFNAALQNVQPKGFVHIVGAGPGDPDLLTLKALRVLQDADIILHDNLVTSEILDLARRDADRIYVGKKKADHAMAQEDIGALMIKLANDGKKVVRLKGGDPFIFGRGGEELDDLQAAGIDAEIIPGITAAMGCGAAAGVPMTHRDHTQSVTFVTGHAKKDMDPDLDWQALAALKNTLVVYMGVGKAPRIANNLIEAGRGSQTPVAIIENGTTDKQIIVRTTLEYMAADLLAGGIKGPAVLIIGEVAAKATGRGLVALATELGEAA